MFEPCCLRRVAALTNSGGGDATEAGGRPEPRKTLRADGNRHPNAGSRADPLLPLFYPHDSRKPYCFRERVPGSVPWFDEALSPEDSRYVRFLNRP